MCTQKLKIGTIPAVLYGKPAPNIWLFVHGQGGNKTEAAAFAALAAPTGWQVLGIDLPEHGDRTGETDFTPWQVVPELQTVLAYLQQHWQGLRRRANSIGAYFSMLAFAGATIEKALFVSGKITQKRRNTKEISAFFIAYSEKSIYLYYIICTFARITYKHNESIYIYKER